MFTLYLDDSGTSPSQRIAVATALVIPAAQLIRFEKEWNSFREKEGFNRFHTSEFIARNSDSEFANWDQQKQVRVFERVRQISMKYGCVAASCSVNKEIYDQSVPENYRAYLGKYHYSFAVSHVIAYLEQHWGKREKPPFEYVFDWMGDPPNERRTEIETVMTQCEKVANEKGKSGIYTSYGFRHSVEIPGLQCVDAIAWTAYRFSLWKWFEVPLNPFVEPAWKDYGGHLGPKGWLRSMVISSNTLREWISKEVADGRSMERFVRWEIDEVAKGGNGNERKPGIRNFRTGSQRIAQGSSRGSKEEVGRREESEKAEEI